MPALAIAPASLHRLRLRLNQVGPSLAAEILQDAGFATGEVLARRWRNFVAERTGLIDAGELDQRWFAPMIDELCVALGWGNIEVTELGSNALLMAAPKWAEAAPGTSLHPACHFTAGTLAAFLTAQAGLPMAVLEVECRSAGHEACCFVASAPAVSAAAYDLLTAGGGWREAFGS
jgi:predicted hydrocarbon binding protein